VNFCLFPVFETIFESGSFTTFFFRKISLELELLVIVLLLYVCCLFMLDCSLACIFII